MNVKIHTPKSLKMGSGMATLKQFLLSLVATTISIVLTFGTAAWLDGKKKEEARREMVMMILYDLAGSIEQAEFSTNIETINTLGNVLFAENVSDIYRLRRQYKQDICDKYMEEFERAEGFKQYEQAMNIDYTSGYIYLSGILINEMKEKIAQCQQMMDVSDADLATYRQKREELSQASAADSIQNALFEEVGQNHQRLKEAREKGKKQTENK